MRTFWRLLRDRSAASAAEYALILAIIGGAITYAAISLSGAIASSIEEAGTCIEDSSTCE